ncbi:heparin lyase I family protein [Undibacterium sp. JH2W]|uniref:heparin lyase I family protein n=1 Tax=Undibacterium sp. JH2W TaxID=3413037 RepID=UPI003BEFE79C
MLTIKQFLTPAKVLNKKTSALLITALVSLNCNAQVKPLPANVSFIGDWNAKTERPGPGVWRDLQTWEKDRIAPRDNERFSPNIAVAEILVKPGDQVGGWSGERAEVSTMQSLNSTPLSVNTGSGHEFYGISVKLPADWKPPVATSLDPYPWGIIFQLHGPDALGTNPAFALCAEEDFHVNLQTGDVLEGGTRTKPKNATRVQLSDGQLSKGKWVKFMIEVTWATDTNGYLAISRLDEGPSAQWTRVYEGKNMPTLQYSNVQPVSDHYWKSGYYRNRGLPFTSSLLLGPVVRGTTFTDVAKAAFGS